MAEEIPVFFVDPNSNPVAVKIVGRASFQNVMPLQDFLKDATKTGSRSYVFDFSCCTGMDSTVLGVLAGCALELRKLEPKGSLVLSHLSERNTTLVRGLGLHRIATLDMGDQAIDASAVTESLDAGQLEELDSARLCLAAHENLVETDGGNETKFQDVISYLKNRISEG